MASGRVKVIGYAQRRYFDQGIEYRNFTNDLVGAQLADSTGALPFSFANIFDTEYNNEGRLTKNFVTNKFSEFITLADIDLSELNIQELIGNENRLYLNIDKSIITNHAYFGSLREFIRVSLENIIINWPASIYLKARGNDYSIQTTVEDYYYDYINDESTFKINVNYFQNPYNIDYTVHGAQSLSGTTTGRSLTVSYMNTGITTGDYNISASTGEFNIIEFTAATKSSNDYIRVKTEGNPFPTLSSTTSGSFTYHIKPNQLKVEAFFNGLNSFESYLLNRNTVPKYKALFTVKIMHEAGNFVYSNKQFIWPVNDGYNLDFESNDYVNYVSDLISLADEMDDTQTNILTRFLVPESITEFDTIPDCSGSREETSGQKVTKTFRIYGREFDEIKKYIDGISFAHTVTYDKKNNIPDGIVKSFAYTLGWDLTNSIFSNDLLTSYLAPSETLYSGYSHGISAFESEIEFWRRLIVNTPWLWKSKGTRKGVEFLLKAVGTPQGLIDFNEYVYVAENQINMDVFKEVNLQINETTDISRIPIDNEGWPSPLRDTPLMYFQQYGLWYRETAGSASTLDKLVGNNPHIGPYDGGSAYMAQFDCLIPNFSSVTLVEEIVTTATTNLFTNYNSGTFNGILSYDAYASCDIKGMSISNIEQTALRYCEEIIIGQCGCHIDEDCTYEANWSINIYLDDNLVYDGGTYYVGTYDGDHPTSTQTLTEVSNGATSLGITSNFVGTILSFTQSTGFGLCEPPNLVGSTILVEICVDYTYECPTVSFTGDCEYCYTLCEADFEEYGTTEEIYVDVYDSNNSIADDCFEITTEGITDPFPTPEITECGCDEIGCDNALRICIREKEHEPSTLDDCGIAGFSLNENGYVIFTLENGKSTTDISTECCKSLGFTPIYINGKWFCQWFDSIPINEPILINGLIPIGESTPVNEPSPIVEPIPIGESASIVVNEEQCYDLTVFDIDKETGLVRFELNGVTTTLVSSAECCRLLGFTPQAVKNGYNCYQE